MKYKFINLKRMAPNIEKKYNIPIDKMNYLLNNYNNDKINDYIDRFNAV